MQWQTGLNSHLKIEVETFTRVDRRSRHIGRPHKGRTPVGEKKERVELNQTNKNKETTQKPATIQLHR